MFGYEFYYKLAKGLKGLKIFEFSLDKAYKRKEDDDYVYEIEVKRYLGLKKDIKGPYYLELSSRQFDYYTSETLNGLAKGIFQLIFSIDSFSKYKWE